jgi:hypothetical protein
MVRCEKHDAAGEKRKRIFLAEELDTISDKTK